MENNETIMENNEIIMENNEIINDEVIEATKDLAIIYTQTAVKMMKLYAPSVALGVLSVYSK